MNIFKHIISAINYLNKFFDPLTFIISLFLGIFIVYSITPPPKVLVKYPTPENSGRVIYKDEAHNCFKVISSEVNCPKDKSKIKSIPLTQN
tara:strand:+ start:312 stop:584 length:273 start_codon:yes stop_codon:yes gene_type:complete